MLLSGLVQAQIDSLVLPVNKGMKYQIGKSPKNFIKLGFHTQLWIRYAQYNNGITDYQGDDLNYDVDFLLRRTAFTHLIVIDKFKFFSNLTVSSQSNTKAISPYMSSGPQLYFYDLWTSYQAIKKYLIIGGGLHMYNGISRYTSASSMQTLGADVPIISAPNLSTTDQSARQLGIFATGNIHKISYRFAINKPFATSNFNGIIIPGKVFHQATHNFSITGYASYQFFDTESNAMPFKTATYLGKKKLLNVGFGFYQHPDATYSYNEDLSISQHDIRHFASDLFFEYPLNNQSALTLYVAKFWFNYGPDYIHSFGVAESFPGSIGEVQFGTGDAYLGQVAYLLPSKERTRRIQPYYELTVHNFEGFCQALYHHNAGVNYFVIGHHLKVTMQYESRPSICNNEVKRRSLLIGKFQFSI